MNLCLRRSIVYDNETIIVFYLIFIFEYIYECVCEPEGEGCEPAKLT